jgi:hypothetical protein
MSRQGLSLLIVIGVLGLLAVLAAAFVTLAKPVPRLESLRVQVAGRPRPRQPATPARLLLEGLGGRPRHAPPGLPGAGRHQPGLEAGGGPGTEILGVPGNVNGPDSPRPGG